MLYPPKDFLDDAMLLQVRSGRNRIERRHASKRRDSWASVGRPLSASEMNED
jgi:hypothetical protein